MKRLLAILLVCVGCLLLIGCEEASSDASVIATQSTADSDGDGYPDDVDLNALEPYRAPIILLHGRVSHTATFFGVNTLMETGSNEEYGPDIQRQQWYTDPAQQKIQSVENGLLGAYLTEQLGYRPNETLFAFQYPNEDMVAKNAALLERYVENLVSAAVEGSVDPGSLFATKEALENRQVRFILIGHSMGGLVSRYYIENISDQYVQKLITICTPHYGSDLSELAGNFGIVLKPCDVDLMSDSALFGGEKKPLQDMPDWMDQEDDRYAYQNQSDPLRGNHNTHVKYYAIGGYDANVTFEQGMPSNEQLRDVSQKLQQELSDGQALAVEFDIDLQSKWAFQDRINEAVNQWSLSQYAEPSHLSFHDNDGDNIVDYMSQLAVQFTALGKLTDHQILQKATLIISSGYNVVNHYHSAIATEPQMNEAVKRYIEAE